MAVEVWEALHPAEDVFRAPVDRDPPRFGYDENLVALKKHLLEKARKAISTNARTGALAEKLEMSKKRLQGAEEDVASAAATPPSRQT